MKIQVFVSTLFLTLVMALVAPNLALGQSLSHGTHQTVVDGALSLGAWMGGSNAVINNFTVTVDTTFNQLDQQFYVYATVSMTGRWGNPNVVTPDMQYLIDNGLQSHNNFSYSVFSFDGVDYMLDTPIEVNVWSSYLLERYFDSYYNDWRLWGSGYANFTGTGVVPVNHSSSISVFNDQTGSNTNWTFIGGVKYRTVGGYHIIPNPSSAALLGLGGLIATRRRRA